jgi:hypothetical protein
MATDARDPVLRDRLLVMKLVAVAAAVAVSVFASHAGCSFLVMGSPKHPPSGGPICRTSRVPAAYDTYTAVGSVVVGAVLSSPNGDQRAFADPAFMMAIAGGYAIPHAISAAYGFRKASECRAAKARWGGTRAPGDR